MAENFEARTRQGSFIHPPEAETRPGETLTPCPVLSFGDVMHRMLFSEFVIIKPEGKNGYHPSTVALTQGPDEKDYEVPYYFVKGLKVDGPYTWVMYVPRDTINRKDLPRRWGLVFDYDNNNGSCYTDVWETAKDGFKRLMGCTQCVCGKANSCPALKGTDEEGLAGFERDLWITDTAARL